MSDALPASLLLRFAALFYDLLVLIAVWMAIAALVLLAFDGDVDVAAQPPLYHWVLQTSLLSATAAYFIVSWMRGGQTIGMRAWRLRIVSTSGPRLPLARAALRFGVALVSLLAAGAGFLWCLVDPLGRSWHDLAADARMVREPKR
ncbi:MAG: RDD family protein [Dokdonella sp.]